jgi:hypothetical protein
MIREMYNPLKKVLKRQLFPLQAMQEATDWKRVMRPAGALYFLIAVCRVDVII